MDPMKNPFSPGAGAPPPELVGRDDVLDQARILLGRVKQSLPEKSMLLTGLRGVGKTVLLNEMRRIAESAEYHTIEFEASEGTALGESLAPRLRSLLYDLDRIEGAKEKVKRGFAVLRSFLGTLKLSMSELTLSLDVDPAKGSADTGDLEIDLPTVFQAVAEAAEDRKRGVALFIDEIQYYNSSELAALIMAMHRIQQRQLPLVLVAAGLPILPGLMGESKSYAERLFSFPDIGALSDQDAARALRDPASKQGVAFETEALDEIFRMTLGYPYFIQEWGYVTWNLTPLGSPVTLPIVRSATSVVVPRLDQNFFRVRFDRLTQSERRFLRGMADLGPGPQRTSEISKRLGTKLNSIGPTRDRLMKKGMIYSPAHGEMAFTVPLFDQFMMRTIPGMRG